LSKRSRKRKGVLRRLRYALEAGLLWGVFGLLRVIPRQAVDLIARGGSSLLFHLAWRRREIALDNLRGAFGPKVEAGALCQIARESYRHWLRSLVELGWLLGRDGDRLLEGVEGEGEDVLREAQARGRGVIVITGHFGNFELMPLWWSRRHGSLTLVVRPLDNPWLEARLGRVRRRFGNRVLGRRHGLAEALRSLRRGETVGVLIDQNMAHRQGLFVEFFGKWACTTRLPALLALRTGAPVVPAFILRLGEGRHRVTIGEEIPLVRTGVLSQDLLLNTARFTQALEGMVRRHPEQWLWVHRRWKNQPPSVVPLNRT
jgi:KDO2-lipid IV(A) lauroyltransferase